MRAASAAQMRSYSPTAAANVSDSGTNSSRGTRTGLELDVGDGAEVQARPVRHNTPDRMRNEE
jgi:hypothetical protein